MKTMRRGFLVLLVFALAMGGASAETVLSEPGTLPLAEETIHLSVGLSQSTVVEDFDTNAQTLRLENDLNVELEFVSPNPARFLTCTFGAAYGKGSATIPSSIWRR